MTYPPQQPQGDWGGQQPYDPSQQGYGQPEPNQQYTFDQQTPGYQPQDPYAQQPPADPYAQPPIDPTQQYSSPPMSVAPASSQPWPGGPGGPMLPPQAPKSGPPVWLFIVGGVVLLALLGVGVVFALNLGGDDNPTDDDKSNSADESDKPSDDPTSDQPNGDLIQDPGTGLSFDAMDSWQPMDTSTIPVKNFTSMAAQSYEVAPEWIALVGVGEIDAGAVGYKDKGDLKDAAKKVAKDYDKNNFGGDLKGFERDKEAEYTEEKLAGADAVTMVYHLTWDDGEAPDTGEQVVLAAIDAGDGRVAGFLGSIPDSTPKDKVDEAVDAVTSLKFS